MTPTPTSASHPILTGGEPFRLLFPFAVVFGLLGMLLWPAFIWNLLPVYPGIPHARIMIECFMGAFVIGFLGTALPRLLDVPRIHFKEALAYATGLSAACGLHLTNLTFWGDLAFLITFAGFVAGLINRARQRKDIPPPAFVLVALGLLSAIAGAILLLLPSPLAYAAGRLLLYQGFLLLPVMGVGAFLLPRFFQLPNRQSFPESMSPPPGWWPKAGFALGCGLLILISFAVEISGHITLAHVLRATGVLLYFWQEVPAHKAKFNSGSLALTLRIALVAIPLGYLISAFWTGHHIAMLHIVFVTGFGLLTLTVATRVIFGHCGQSHRFKATVLPVLVMAALFLGALLLRIWADFTPVHRFTLYGIGALVWTVGLLVWSICILPAVRHPDEE